MSVIKIEQKTINQSEKKTGSRYTFQRLERQWAALAVLDRDRPAFHLTPTDLDRLEVLWFSFELEVGVEI